MARSSLPVKPAEPKWGITVQEASLIRERWDRMWSYAAAGGWGRQCPLVADNRQSEDALRASVMGHIPAGNQGEPERQFPT